MLQQWLNQRYEVFIDSAVSPVLSLFTMKVERLYISTSNYFGNSKVTQGRHNYNAPLRLM